VFVHNGDPARSRFWITFDPQRLDRCTRSRFLEDEEQEKPAQESRFALCEQHPGSRWYGRHQQATLLINDQSARHRLTPFGIPVAGILGSERSLIENPIRSRFLCPYS
jgi:hypothetical protein